jgi:hypothetical protein
MVRFVRVLSVFKLLLDAAGAIFMDEEAGLGNTT